MKKLIAHIVITLIAFCIIKPSFAFFWVYPIDGFPTPDFIDQASAILKSGAALGQSTQTAIKFGVDTANNLKSAVMSVYQGELSTLVGENSTNAGQKTMADCSYKCKTYKNTSSDDVYTLTKILFQQYPGKDPLENKKYDEYREQFYRDNLIEIFTAANELQMKMEGDIKASIDSSIECITTNGQKCNIPNADGNTDALFVEGKAHEAMSNLFEVLLKVTALKAQFVAIQAINSIEPAAYVSGVENQTADTSDEDDEEEESGGDTDEDEVASLHKSETLAFAQVEMKNNARSTLESLIKTEVDTQQEPDGFISFVTPPESPIAHTYVAEGAQIEELEKVTDLTAAVDNAVEIHNTIHGLEDYKNMAESLKTAKEQYERALEALKKVDACARKYIGRHFKNPDQVWGATPSNITNHDARTGISGWAYNAYETAKAAEVNVETEEGAKEAIGTSDIVSPDIDMDEQASSLSNNFEDNMNNSTKLLESKFSSPGKGKEEQSLAENRKAHMLFWQIGAEASKMLAANPSAWGTPRSSLAFPIWQDVKSYYGQYLENKYANIKAYLQSFNTADVLAVIAEQLRGNERDASESLQQQNARKANETLARKYAELDNKILTNNKSKNSKIAQLQKQREALITKLNNASDDLKNASANVEAIRSKAQDVAGEAMRNKVTAKTKFPTMWGEEISQDVGIGKVASAEEENKAISENMAANKKSLGLDEAKEDVANAKSKVSNLEKELKKLDEEINKEKELAQESGETLNAEIDAEKVKIAEELLGGDNGESQYFNDVKKNIDWLLSSYSGENLLKKAQMLGDLEKLAKQALKKVNDAVDAEVSAAQSQMQAMGDGLYDPHNHDKIVKIHQQMINNIKAKAVINISGIDGLPSIKPIYLLSKLLSVDTSAEEEDYFVGNTPKERDVKAPKAVFANKLPPLREVFHFDATDFNNVTPYNKKNNSRRAIIVDDFLNIGGEIPLVWKYMLRPHAYVEADIDMDKVLNLGCETQAYFRGGVMPCRIKNTNMVLDVNEKSKLIVTAAAGDYAECSLFELKGDKLYHPRRKTKNEKDVYLDIKFVSDMQNINCRYSELGSLLDVQLKDVGAQNSFFTSFVEKMKKKAGMEPLKFRKEVHEAYYAILEELNSDGKGFGKEKEEFLGQVEKLPMDRNQIGEFLFYAENEKNMRQKMAELEKEYNSMKENLFDKLRQYGYEPSPDLDFSKKSDYDLVRKQLDNAKNAAVQEAQRQASEIKTAGFEVVEERVGTQQGIINALIFDKDESAMVSGGMDEDDSYETTIKSNNVNRKAIDTYGEKMEESMSAYKLPEMPYCAVY